MKTEGCLRPSTSTISSDIILPVPTSRPLLTEMMGTSWGNSSCSSDVHVNQKTSCVEQYHLCHMGTGANCKWCSAFLENAYAGMCLAEVLSLHIPAAVVLTCHMQQNLAVYNCFVGKMV